MTESIAAKIKDLETRLADAMQTSDVSALDELLAEDLLFTNHDGKQVTKHEDLALHRSGLLKLEKLSLSEVSVRELGDSAVVSAHVQLAGRYAESAFEGAFRFTRVWALRDSRWQVVAAHSSTVVR